MKKNKIHFLTVLFAVMLLLQGCIHPDLQDRETDSKEQPKLPENPKHYYEEATYVYHSAVDTDTLLTGLSQTYLLLANKVFPLEQEYVPAPLVTLTCKTYYDKEVLLESRTAAALYEMLDEMHLAGFDDIMVTSGYRSYSYQVSLNNYYIGVESQGISANAYAHFGYAYIQTNYLAKGLTALSGKDAEAVVRSYSAEPGKSEHQTGLCIDFITSDMDDLNTDFENTNAFAWLSEHAYQFGFILRYPKGKEDITGYTYEPWHYRFVGREAATDIYFGNTTLEEYLGTV